MVLHGFNIASGVTFKSDVLCKMLLDRIYDVEKNLPGAILI